MPKGKKTRTVDSETSNKTEEVNAEEVTEVISADPDQTDSHTTGESAPLISLLIKDYVGFADGLLDGFGKVYYTEGHVYEGTFMNGQMQGRGSIVWQDGLKYEGDFHMNEITGNGKYTWPNKNLYEGEVDKGVRNGNGKFTYVDGSYYTGGWVGGKKQGFGYFENGDQSYEGTWVDNLPHGYGIRKYANGDSYEGNFTRGIRHGKGKMCWNALKQSYCGDWKYNHKSGKGTHVWHLDNTGKVATHNKYVGEFMDDEKHGFGILYYADGAVFEGEFSRGRKNGKGRITFKNGRFFEGEFVKDQLTSVGLVPSEMVGEIAEKVVSSKNPLPIVNSHVANRESPEEVLSLDVNLPILKELAPSLFENFNSVLNVVSLHLRFLRDVFQHYGSLGVPESQRYIIRNFQLWQIMKDCQFDCADYSVADLAWGLSAATGNHVCDPNEEILFETFISYLLILAQKLFRHEDSAARVKALIETKMIPNALRGPHREIVFGDRKITENVFHHFEKSFDIYREHLSKTDRFGTWREFLHLIKNLKLLNNDFSCTHVLSVMAGIDCRLVDEFNHYSLERTMTFLDFLECLVGFSKIYVTEQMLNQSLSTYSLQVSTIQVEKTVDSEDDLLSVDAGEVTENTEIKEDLKQFNFWTHQLHFFFINVLYPSTDALSRITRISRNL